MTVRRVGEHSLHIAASMSRLFYSPLSSSPYTSAPQAGVTGGNATRRGEKRAEEASSGTKGTTNERRGWERYSEKDMITINPRFVKSNCIK